VRVCEVDSSGRGSFDYAGLDADADLSALAGTEAWDVVLDIAGYYESAVRRMAELLKGRVKLALEVNVILTPSCTFY
jgi:hypothetical protein